MDVSRYARKPLELNKLQQREQLLIGAHHDTGVPFFTRAIVKEIDLIGGKLNDVNPKNSIRARIINLTINDNDPILYPMFSAHLSLPLKLDEEVWVFFENISNLHLGYWIRRVPELLQTDDINFVSWRDKNKVNSN